MMRIITDNDLLNSVFPNVLSPVDNEQNLFEKVSLFLESSETWLESNVTGGTINDIAKKKNSTVFNAAARFIASSALIEAVPALDVVLTQNGFAVVNNENVAPASKERIERLIHSLRKIKNAALRAVIAELPTFPSWKETKQFEWFKQSLICKPEDVVAIDKDSDADEWTEFCKARTEAAELELEMAEKFISEDLMKKCREDLTLGNIFSEYGNLGHRLRQILILSMREKRLRERALLSLVNYIRKNTSMYPEWQTSDTAKLFTPSVFKNEKNKSGYIF